MTLGSAAAILRSAVMELGIISAPILLASLAVGLIVSILQAATSIQEPTLSFVPKIAAVLGLLLLLGPWLATSMVDYTRALFQSISTL